MKMAVDPPTQALFRSFSPIFITHKSFILEIMKFSAILSACLLASVSAFAPSGVAAPRYVGYIIEFGLEDDSSIQVRKIQQFESLPTKYVFLILTLLFIDLQLLSTWLLLISLQFQSVSVHSRYVSYNMYYPSITYYTWHMVFDTRYSTLDSHFPTHEIFLPISISHSPR